MTREEVISYFRRHINLYCVTGTCREAEEMAIKALEQLTSYEQTINKLTEAISEQEPCEDAISRQAVLEKAVYTETEEGWSGMTVDVKDIEALPSVKPQEPKTGHWIEIAKYSDGNHKIECSECKSHIFDRGHANSFNVKNKYKYCPNCGAKMESET